MRVALTLLAVLTLALAGCAGDGKKAAGDSGDPLPPPAAVSDDPFKAARELVLARYYPLWGAIHSAYNLPADQRKKALQDILGDPELSSRLNKMAELDKAKRKRWGEPAQPVAQQVRIADPDNGEVKGCVDESGAGVADAAGKHIDEGLPRRVVTVQYRRIDGMWLAVVITYPGGTCG